MIKTNKSYAKRLKITKSGKILALGTGRNHFNAKEGRRSQLGNKRSTEYPMGNKDKALFINTIAK